MEKKNLMPQQAQPIERITTGQLPDVLAELSEEALSAGDASLGSMSVLPLTAKQEERYGGMSLCGWGGCNCSYDGDE